MKRFRACYFGFAAILLFSALLTGRREFFLLVFMYLFVSAYALALNIWTALSFSFVQELSASSSVKGACPTLKIGIYNDKPFPFTLMRIHVETVLPSAKTALRFNLSPLDSILFEVPVYCAYRGEYHVGMTVIEVTDIFGLFHIRYDLRSLPYYRKRILKIYPKLNELRFIPAAVNDSKLSGGVAERTAEYGESYQAPRDYRPGDSEKRIHWIASARARKLMSKSYETPVESSALIIIDNAANGLEGEPLMRYADLACECACAIACHCVSANYHVKLISAEPDGHDTDSAQKAGFAHIYDLLAVLPFGVEDGLSARIETETRTGTELEAIYILTARMNAELAGVLAVPIKNKCAVKCLLLDAGCVEADSGSAARTVGISVTKVSFGDDIASVLEGML